jgi:hypothetical protein
MASASSDQLVGASLFLGLFGAIANYISTQCVPCKVFMHRKNGLT